MSEQDEGEKIVPKLTIVHGDDWEGIYVGDDLQTEGHSIALAEGIAFAIEHKVTGVTTMFADLDWLRREGRLPQHLGNVKGAK
jgi:hypothetical protein